MREADTAIFDGHECVVLSALMNGENALPVCADDFASTPNRTIFNRVSGLTNRGLLAVTDALRATANWRESAAPVASPRSPRCRMIRKI